MYQVQNLISYTYADRLHRMPLPLQYHYEIKTNLIMNIPITIILRVCRQHATMRSFSMNGLTEKRLIV